jgi:hypothetical protein
MRRARSLSAFEEPLQLSRGAIPRVCAADPDGSLAARRELRDHQLEATMRFTTLGSGAVLAALAGLMLTGKSAQSDERAAAPSQASTKVRSATADWPAKPREAARMLAAKYGDPDEVTPSMLIWNARGPWKRTIVYREEVAHSFPKPHTDFLEQVIDYRVPTDKADDLAAYDGSVIIERTKGELSARCDKEELNMLALNLANDVATGAKDIEAARKAYAENAMAFLAGKKTPYTQALQFRRTAERTADPDQPFKPEMARR